MAKRVYAATEVFFSAESRRIREESTAYEHIVRLEICIVTMFFTAIMRQDLHVSCRKLRYNCFAKKRRFDANVKVGDFSVRGTFPSP